MRISPQLTLPEPSIYQQEVVGRWGSMPRTAKIYSSQEPKLHASFYMYQKPAYSTPYAARDQTDRACLFVKLDHMSVTFRPVVHGPAKDDVRSFYAHVSGRNITFDRGATLEVGSQDSGQCRNRTPLPSVSILRYKTPCVWCTDWFILRTEPNPAPPPKNARRRPLY